MAVEAGVLAREIAAAHQGMKALTLSSGDLSEWVTALQFLLSEGALEAAEFGTRLLLSEAPTVSFARHLGAVLDRLPTIGPHHLPFRDDLAQEVQIVRRPGSETVILAFCDFGNHLGLPLSVMHRWLGQLPASVIYLRDFRYLFHVSGVEALGGSRDLTVEALRRIIALLGAKRILCYGNSSGVFPALQYGLELEANAVLALAGPTNLSTGFDAYRQGSPMSRVSRIIPEAAIDLKQSYADAAQPPRALIVYGENSWDDRLQAENMAGLPSITLQTLEGSVIHNVTMALIGLGRFEALLDWLIKK